MQHLEVKYDSMKGVHFTSDRRMDNWIVNLRYLVSADTL